MTKIVVFDNGEKFSEEEGDLGIFCTVRIRKSSQKKDAIDIRGGVIGKGEDGLVLDALIKNAVSINEKMSNGNILVEAMGLEGMKLMIEKRMDELVSRKPEPIKHMVVKMKKDETDNKKDGR